MNVPKLRRAIHNQRKLLEQEQQLSQGSPADNTPVGWIPAHLRGRAPDANAAVLAKRGQKPTPKVNPNRNRSVRKSARLESSRQLRPSYGPSAAEGELSLDHKMPMQDRH